MFQGAEKTLKTYKCSLCKKTGHNKKTCDKNLAVGEPHGAKTPKVNTTRPATTANGSPSTQEHDNLTRSYMNFEQLQKLNRQPGGPGEQGQESTPASVDTFNDEMLKVNKKYNELKNETLTSEENLTPEDITVWWELQIETQNIAPEDEASVRFWQNHTSMYRTEEQRRNARTVEELEKFLQKTEHINPDMIASFVKTFPEDIKRGFNYKTRDVAVLKVLALSVDNEEDAKELLRNKKLPLFSIVRMRENANAAIRLAAVSATRLKGRNVDYYAEDTTDAVKVFVGKKTNNKKILHHYATHNTNPTVVMAVCGNPATAPETLVSVYENLLCETKKSDRHQVGNEKLMKENMRVEEKILLYKILQNKNTPDDLRARIRKDLTTKKDMVVGSEKSSNTGHADVTEFLKISAKKKSL